jgi:hypothetical protein
MVKIIYKANIANLTGNEHHEITYVIEESSLDLATFNVSRIYDFTKGMVEAHKWAIIDDEDTPAKPHENVD